MATFNVRGQKGNDDGINKIIIMRKLLKWAHTISLDAPFIQEHVTSGSNF